VAYTCPICERELRSLKQWHNCVNRTVGDLLTGRNQELILTCDALLATIISWPDVIASTTQNCIVFVHKKTFLIIRPLKTVLDIKFFSQTELIQEDILKSIPYSGKYENHIRISKTTDLTPNRISLFRASYLLL
jgi:hypothetical protein